MTDDIEQYRNEIALHCYRMIGSFEDAEDVTQDVMLKAWRSFDTFDGRSSVRTWLYRIAGNACIDHVRSTVRRPTVSAEAFASLPAQVAVPWLQPYPEPSETVHSRDTVRLAFVAAVQFLPPRQRGALLLRDCLGWPVAECASALNASAAAVNSSLQRARATMRTVLDEDSAAWRDEQVDHTLVERYIAAIDSADDDVIGALLRDDVRVSHAPGAGGNSTDATVWYSGRDAVIAAWWPILHADDRPDIRMVPLRLAGDAGVATYIRMQGSAEFIAFALNSLTTVDGIISEVAAYPVELFSRFGLAERFSTPDPAS